MSNVIQFLERLGRDAPIGDGSAEAYANAVGRLDIDSDLREALLRKDRDALNRLLGARHNVMLVLVPAEDEPGRDEPVDDDEIHASRTGTAC